MSGKQKVALVATLAALVGVSAKVVSVVLRPISLQGAVIQQSSDPREQQPIAGVEITEANGLAARATESDASGFFKLTLLGTTRAGEHAVLRFRHPDYEPLDLDEAVGNQIYIVRMAPVHAAAKPNSAEEMVTNVLVRYTIEVQSMVNVGSAVKTFEVVNTGNVPCDNHSPCSPDGKWKAAVGGSSTLDAGEGNVFRNARVSCIAGPCPFTKIETDGFSEGGQHISAVARDWSDTTTFLLQAEVFHLGISDAIQNAHPVIFGRDLSFTLPAEARGPSLEVELRGTPIVCPLGPNPSLSWAECDVRAGKDQSLLYRCKLKPGYRFP